MNTLNSDAMFYVSSFMDRVTTLSFVNVNKQTQAMSGKLLKNQYEKHFGQIGDNILNPDKKIFARLLKYAETQPDVLAKHKIYDSPNSRLEKLKWLVGVENKLDKEIQETYNASIHLLERTQATSILQLKNQLQGFWRLDSKIKDYKHFKSEKIAIVKGSLINKFFLFCVEVIFKLYYNPSVIATRKKLISRSEEIFAKIGCFNHSNKQYDVVAFHIVRDDNQKANLVRKFKSIYDGETWIAIFEKDQPKPCLSDWLEKVLHFNILIGRKAALNNEICSESSGNLVPVLKNNRHLKIHPPHRYIIEAMNDHGSDRVLAQKLTQIMIEMVMQNKEIISLKIDSREFIVLLAGGFKTKKNNPIDPTDQEEFQKLVAFRSVEGNKLFPPYKIGAHRQMSFEAKNLANRDVYYSRRGPESWSDIIQREPILTPNSAVLPEYWSTKPYIVELRD